jgi:hypothetical protein
VKLGRNINLIQRGEEASREDDLINESNKICDGLRARCTIALDERARAWKKKKKNINNDIFFSHRNGMM